MEQPRPPQWVLDSLPPNYDYIWSTGDGYWFAIWVADHDDLDVAGTLTAYVLDANRSH